MILVTPQQMKHLECQADKNGNTYEMLMDKAGKGLAEKISFYIKTHIKKDVEIVFLCGNGNNGGDCFVAARYLKECGIDSVSAIVCGKPSTEISIHNYLKLNRNNILTDKEKIINMVSSESEKIIVDGVFGTGFHGELPEEIKKIFDACNNCHILAVDVPSGGNCFNGNVSKGTLKANETYTFGFKKTGLEQYPLKQYCGKTSIIDIEIPKDYTKELEKNFFLIDENFVKSVIPSKAPDSHKGNYGKILIICGCEKMPGACVMASEAAARTGVGIVQTASVERVVNVINQRLPEAMTEILKSDSEGYISVDEHEKIIKLSKRADAVLIGCGIGNTKNTAKLVKTLLKEINCPIILDADGINCIADSIDIIKEVGEKLILTPHPAEMGRLCGKTAAEIQSDRLGTVLDFVNNFKCVLVLKGAGTIIAQKSKIAVNPNGNPGMAKGGSGDVLAGIISSLAAQKIPLFEAATAGTFLHGMSGDISAKNKSMQCMLAEDIIENLSGAFKNIIE